MRLVRLTRLVPVQYVVEHEGVLTPQIAFITPEGVQALSVARAGADDEVRLVLLPVPRPLGEQIIAKLVEEDADARAN